MSLIDQIKTDREDPSVRAIPRRIDRLFDLEAAYIREREAAEELAEKAWEHIEAFCIVEDSGMQEARDALRTALAAMIADREKHQ